MFRLFGSRGKTYSFFLRGGQILEVENVQTLTMHWDKTTGRFTGYTITWVEGTKPEFFSITADDISAVTCTE